MAPRALLLSSDEKVTALLGEAVAPAACEVCHCKDIFSAVEAITRERFDLILIDWQEALEADFLLKTARDLRLHEALFAVGLTTATQARQALESGADAILVRPFTAAQAAEMLLPRIGLQVQTTSGTTASIECDSHAPEAAVAVATPVLQHGPASKENSAVEARKRLPAMPGAGYSIWQPSLPLPSRRSRVLSLTAILWPVVIVTALLVFDQWPNWSRRTSAQFAGWFEAAHARTGKFLASRIQAPASSNEPASQHVAFAITDDLLSDYASPTRPGPDAGAVLANGPKDIDVGSVEMLPSSTRVMAPVFTVDDIRPKLEIPASLRFPPPEHPAGITPGGHLVAVDWNQAPIALPEAVSRALLEHQVAPQYPYQALRTGADGPVVFVASIGKDGAVRELKLVSGYLVLAHAAVDAVKQWRYKPYRRNGENVEIETLITVNFKRPPRG